MWRTRRLAGIAVATGLVLSGLTASAAVAAGPACGGSGATTTVNGTLSDGATYEMQCPAGAWNGTLFLYSHGYVEPGAANPAADAGDPVTAAWMLGQGYALAGSSYATTGWAVQQALPDQINTLDTFDATYGKPTQTVAWGHSLGGMITAGLIQDYPNRFNAALPMCGVLSGGVATWNTALDAAFAFQQLIDPSVQVVNITNPTANLQGAEAAVLRRRRRRKARPGSPCSPHSMTRPAGLLRGPRSPPRRTTPRRKPTSTCGTRRSRSRSSSTSAPTWRRMPAATRRGTPA
jgi:pimeloyl-ACP methyl ester carboxylesterase